VAPLAQRIVLFDIDGTLLLTNRAGTKAMNRAFRGLFDLPASPPALDGLDIAGRSDTWIMKATMRNHGIDHTARSASDFVAAYAHELSTTLRETGGHLLPGITPLLDALAGEDVVLGLGTGNFRATGMAKLNHFGIGHYFLDGGFGDDSAERPKILAAGVRRLRARAVRNADVVVVGDTVHDVTAGHAIGAKVVAVTTGSSTYDELAAVGADTILASCEVLDEALAAIIG
jgi:phosphoglycolate phosphatase-like HAD superfamily hydrolase